MPLSVEGKDKIEKAVTKAIRDKLERYSPETDEMPFHYRLIGKDRIYLYRFIHSLSTTFGTSVFEPVAKIIAESNYVVTLKQDMGSEMSENSAREIDKIMSDITAANITPDHEHALVDIATANAASLALLRLFKIFEARPFENRSSKGCGQRMNESVKIFPVFTNQTIVKRHFVCFWRIAF